MEFPSELLFPCRGSAPAPSPHPSHQPLPSFLYGFSSLTTSVLYTHSGPPWKERQEESRDCSSEMTESVTHTLPVEYILIFCEDPSLPELRLALSALYRRERLGTHPSPEGWGYRRALLCWRFLCRWEGNPSFGRARQTLH